MPRDFKSFLNESENIINENKEDTNKYQDIINKYKNMNNSELMSNLFSEASKLKKDGKLNSSTLQNLESTLKPFLNNEQQQMLNSLIDKINEQK